MQAIALAGLLCGALDISAAFLVYGARYGLKPVVILQSISAALLGKGAYRGGLQTALLGLALHFLVAFSWAALYFALSRRFRILTQKPFLCGALYAVFVYFFMQLVVLPLSRTGFRPQHLEPTLIGLAIHLVCVGLPIALVIRRFAR